MIQVLQSQDQDILLNLPIVWLVGVPKLQTQISLSITEAEYIDLSMAMRDVVPIINVLKELKDKRFIHIEINTDIHCTAFEGNSGALELARAPGMCPRTKYINLVYHWFVLHVKTRIIRIYQIASEDQIIDINTKPLPVKAFVKHRKKIFNW